MIDNLHRVTTQLILNGRKMKQMKEETKVFFSQKKEYVAHIRINHKTSILAN